MLQTNIGFPPLPHPTIPPSPMEAGHSAERLGPKSHMCSTNKKHHDPNAPYPEDERKSR